MDKLFLCTVCMDEQGVEAITTYVQERLNGRPKPEVGFDCCELCGIKIKTKDFA